MKTSIPLLLAALACAATGCASGHGSLTIRARQTNDCYFENFAKACISGPSEGEYDIVLLNEDLPAGPDRAKGRVEPLVRPPVKQAMVIHVLWRPDGSALARESSVTNAIVDWYVFGGGDDRHADMLHYGGAGFVRLYSKRGATTVDIRNAQVRLKDRHGDMRDQLGPCLIEGSLFAVPDDRRVHDLLAQIQDQADQRKALASDGDR